MYIVIYVTIMFYVYSYLCYDKYFMYILVIYVTIMFYVYSYLCVTIRFYVYSYLCYE